MRRKRWTKEEDDIIRVNYPRLGIDAVQLLLDRDIKALQQRASILGIKSKKRKRIFPKGGINYKNIDN